MLHCKIVIYPILLHLILQQSCIKRRKLSKTFNQRRLTSQKPTDQRTFFDSTTKSNSRFSRKIATSRSPSVQKSSRKERLSVEDLNLTQEDSRTDIFASLMKKKARSGSSRNASPMSTKKMVTPVKDLSSSKPKPQKSARSKSKKKTLEIGPTGGFSVKNPPISILGCPVDDTPSSHTFTGKFGVPTTFSSDSTKKLLTSVNSNGKCIYWLSTLMEFCQNFSTFQKQYWKHHQ